MAPKKPFNILSVGLAGRLQDDAILLAASPRANSPGFTGKLLAAEPQPGPLWPRDPRMTGDVRTLLEDELGATIQPFESRHFGATYPYGNKIEALACLPE